MAVSGFSVVFSCWRGWGRWLLLLSVLSSLLSGCAVQQTIANRVADQLATQSAGSENDLELAREASAFYLKFSESLLKQTPEHDGLAQAVAAGFTQYAYAFVSQPADELESRDAKAAAALRERAAKLYRRGRDHALTALERHHPTLRQQLGQPTASLTLTPQQVGLAYWAAASWGGLISLSKDDPDTVADLPLAIRLAEIAYAAQPEFGQGSLASLLGTFESARPNGNARKALAYFDQAIALGAGQQAGALVSKAEGHAQPRQDRALFGQLLQQALALRDAPDSPYTLQNEVMRRRARWLLQNADDLF
jgi:predicted anti-sigma-YlaC factor YlaD